ncbi:MAG: TonB-dependent receptor [Pseudomonadota bacterium]
MFKRNKLRSAIITAMASSAAAGSAHAELEELVVTATKRQASMQTVPVSVNALQEDALDDYRVQDFGDYVQMLPNVNIQGTGPGQNEVYIRGAATEQSVLSISTTQGSAPAVAFYQDEQPVSFGGRNLDVYATDLERIEVLPGPQGTLFGVSSQAGTVRLITNKPRVGEFEAGFDASASSTKGGEMSHSTEAYLNLPLADNLAFRLAAFNDHQGGWIDNVPNDPDNGGYSPSIEVINRNDITAAPVNPNTPFEAADNSQFVEDDFNDATYAGARFGVAYYADNWDLLVQHTQQTLDSEGVFSYDPNLGDEDEVNRFNPDWNQDEFGLTTWTLNARLAQLDVVYTGGFLDRDVDSAIDYTGYTNGGGYQVYYLCTGTRDFAGNGAESVPADGACYDPDKLYQEETDSTRFTQELRVTTPEQNRWRLLGGLFYDIEETETVSAFELASTPDVDVNGDPIPNSGAFQPLAQVGNVAEGANAGGEMFGPRISFVNDFTRETEQFAVFGEAQFDITPDITAAVSARWYDLEFAFEGTTNSSFGCKFAEPGFFPETNYLPEGCDGAAFDNDVSARLEALGTATPEALEAYFGLAEANAVLADIGSGNLDVSDLNSDGKVEESDVIVRASLDWQLNDEVMLFSAYSEGFRPPMANRNAGRAANSTSGPYANYRVPPVAVTDTLENYELGAKMDLLDRTLRLNVTGYYSEITDLQTSRFDPSNVAFLVFIENVGDAEVRGIDAEFSWLPTPNLTLGGAISYLDTEITDLNAQLQDVAVPEGSELPFSPELSGSLRARYDFDVPALDGRGYVSGTLAYTGESKSGITGNANFVEDTSRLVYGRGTGLEIESEGGVFVGTGGEEFENARYVQEDYTLLNVAVGVRKDEWRAELFVDNLTDKRAEMNIDTLSFTPKVVTNRPRTIGFRVSYDMNR